MWKQSLTGNSIKCKRQVYHCKRLSKFRIITFKNRVLIEVPSHLNLTTSFKEVFFSNRCKTILLKLFLLVQALLPTWSINFLPASELPKWALVDKIFLISSMKKGSKDVCRF